MTETNLQGQPIRPPAHIALQPVSDRHYCHRADALLYRRSMNAKKAEILDPAHATASAVLLAIYEIGLPQLVGNRDLLVKAPNAWLNDPDLMPPAHPQLILEVDAADSLSGEAFAALARRGYRICLSCEGWPEGPLPSSVEFLKIPAQQVQANEASVGMIRSQKPDICLIAHRVENQAQFDRCLSAGFDWFQGYFYAEPMTVPGISRQGDANRQILLRILQELHQDEPDIQKLTSWLTQLPHAILLLLKRANAAGAAGVRSIENVSEALMRLGLADIKTLIASLLMTDMGAHSRLLLPDVLTRAAFCRLVAQSQPNLEADTGFSVGLLSQLPMLLGMSLDELLAQVRVSPAIEQALRHRQGDYGKLLRLAEAFEQATLSQQNRALIDRLNHQYLHARAWTQTLLDVL
ncbi:MAG: EAL and HDOD domain-containing protein [Saccharospirillum sp.]